MSSILALDVGEKRVGVALASRIALLPSPLTTLKYEEAIECVCKIADEEDVKTIVVGMPMNIQHQPTEQTRFTEAFIAELKQKTSASIATCDEALSSQRAKKELIAKRKPFSKEAIDALAATFILEDYLKEEHLV